MFSAIFFSSDKETVNYVAKMAPLVAISLVLEGLQGVLSGIARGTGWQHIGAYISLGAFYLWGIPIAASLAFWIRLKGVWPLDRNPSRCRSANSSARPIHRLHKLGKAGP